MNTNTATVKGYTRTVNGQVHFVEGHERGIGTGFTRDGRRVARAQVEFEMIKKDADRAAKLAAFRARQRSMR